MNNKYTLLNPFITFDKKDKNKVSLTITADNNIEAGKKIYESISKFFTNKLNWFMFTLKNNWTFIDFKVVEKKTDNKDVLNYDLVEVNSGQITKEHKKLSSYFDKIYKKANASNNPKKGGSYILNNLSKDNDDYNIFEEDEEKYKDEEQYNDDEDIWENIIYDDDKLENYVNGGGKKKKVDSSSSSSSSSSSNNYYYNSIRRNHFYGLNNFYYYPFLYNRTLSIIPWVIGNPYLNYIILNRIF